MPASESSVKRDGDALVFSGALDRALAETSWLSVGKALAGTQRIVLTEVTTVDSAGLALLATLAAQLRAAGVVPRIEGAPAGLAELCNAYRLTPELDFPGPAPTSNN